MLAKKLSWNAFEMSNRLNKNFVKMTKLRQSFEEGLISIFTES